jgi:hypothetical protein
LVHPSRVRRCKARRARSATRVPVIPQPVPVPAPAPTRYPPSRPRMQHKQHHHTRRRPRQRGKTGSSRRPWQKCVARSHPRLHTRRPRAKLTPQCHLRTLIITGQSHVFSFEPELTVGRVVSPESRRLHPCAFVGAPVRGWIPIRAVEDKGWLSEKPRAPSLVVCAVSANYGACGRRWKYSDERYQGMTGWMARVSMHA